MTTGFVLIFLGLQLHLVNTFVLTPRFSNFLAEHASGAEQTPTQAFLPSAGYTNPMAQNQNSPFFQASFPQNTLQNPQAPMMPMAAISNPRLAGPKSFSPPKWLCWPVLFMGTVVLLHGISMRRS